MTEPTNKLSDWTANDGHAVMADWSAVEAVGPDAGKFLQSFCTNDVVKLVDGESCEAMFTDVKAHVVAYAWIVRQTEDCYVALLFSDRAEVLCSHLDRYLIREQVELRIVAPGPWTVGTTAVGDLAIPVTALGEGLVASYGEVEGKRIPTEEFERRRIRLGVPSDGVDVDERNLPQEVDRVEQSISFTKGCYLGQEPVARIDALGRVNWLLRGVTVEGAVPSAGEPLTAEGKSVGRITSAIQDGQQAIALAYVRREHSVAGIQLSLGDREAFVSELPMA